MDFERTAAELVQAVRGNRSQNALSRRAGYRSNIVRRWERGACWPTVARFLELCALLKLDVDHCYTDFLHRRPDWLDAHGATSAATVAAFLRELRGKTPILELARVSGFNRYSVSRWLSGTAEPKLPEFLRLIETASGRLLDFLATLVDPAALPSVAPRWTLLRSARELAYGQPWSHAVLRALELEDYARFGYARPGWLATKLGLPETQVQQALAALQETGQIRERRARGGSRYDVKQVLRVNTGQDPVRSRSLDLAWTRFAARKLARSHSGSFGFSLFAISKADLRKLRDLHQQYVRAMQSLIASSRATDCVGLYCAQLIDLEDGPQNALAEK